MMHIFSAFQPACHAVSSIHGPEIPASNGYTPLSLQHNQVLAAAKSRLQAEYRSHDWELVTVKRDVKISGKAPLGSELPMLRGEGIISGFTPAELVTIVQCNQSSWDKRMLPAEILDRFDRDTIEFYAKLPSIAGIVCARDFVGLHRVEFGHDQDLTAIYQTSIEDPYRAPENSQFVRGRLNIGGWFFEALQGQSATKVTYMAHIDLAGSVPRKLAAMANTEIALNVASVRMVALEQGFTPYIQPNADVTVNKEIYNAANKTYTAFITSRGRPADFWIRYDAMRMFCKTPVLQIKHAKTGRSANEETFRSHCKEGLYNLRTTHPSSETFIITISPR